MSAGLYDKDCTTWSPQGEIQQIKYVMNAVTQGTCVIGLRSKDYAILAAFKKRGQSEFCSYDEKLFKIDDHCGVAIAGLTADARVLADYMRNECLNHKYVYDSPMVIGRLVAQIGEKSQLKTLMSGKRPFGVGMLIQAWEEDQQKACIYETTPAGDYYEYCAMAIGARAQAAKTYLEKNYESFYDETDLNKLIKHAVKAVHVTTEQDTELTVENLDVTIVGKGINGWDKLDKARLAPLVEEFKAAAEGEDAVMAE